MKGSPHPVRVIFSRWPNFIHHGGEMGPAHMFQFDPEIFPLAHGAIHIATVGDFDLDLPGAKRNFIA